MKTLILTWMLFCLIGGGLERSPVAAQGGTLAINNGQIVASRPSVAVSSSNSHSSLRADREFPKDFGMPRVNDLLCHHRRRTGSSFDSHFQGNGCVANYGHISLTQCGTVVVARNIAQSFMFLGATTTRGPPGSGHQKLYPFNGTPDRPIRLFCTNPLLPPLPSHDLTSARHLLGPFLPSAFLNGAGALFDPTGFPNQYTPTVHQKELL